MTTPHAPPSVKPHRKKPRRTTSPSWRNRPTSMVWAVLGFVLCFAFFAMLEVIVVERTLLGASGSISSSSSSGGGGGGRGDEQHRMAVVSPAGAAALNNLRQRPSNPSAPNNNNNKQQVHPSKPKPRRGKTMAPLEDMLKKAGVKVTPELLKQLPPASEVEELYGEEPILHGLGTCGTFKKMVPEGERIMAPAGMFHSGTTLLAKLLQTNCIPPQKNNKKSTTIHTQVPWGKHHPITSRKTTTTTTSKTIHPDHVLPIVIVKDPYTWMSSMCRHEDPQQTSWFHPEFAKTKRCPNLFPVTVEEIQEFPHAHAIPIQVNYDKNGNGNGNASGNNNRTKHDSLVHYWNDWHIDYHDKSTEESTSFPRLFVRYEDVLFHTEKVVESICKCGGMQVKKQPWLHVQEKEGLVEAMVRYGNGTKRVDGYWDLDLLFARRSLDRLLMDYFGYKHPVLE